MFQASPYKRSHNRIHSGQGLLRGITVGGCGVEPEFYSTVLTVHPTLCKREFCNSEIITVHYCTAAGSLLQLDIKTEKLVLTYSTCADTGKVDEVKMPLSIC